jgi:chemotaxis protein MotB
MANDKSYIVIVRRLPDEEPEHHGGVWKIALADFMTAMMALFLVLWLCNAAPKETKTAIANYFNPISLSATLPTRKGVNDPEGIPAGDASGSGAQEPDTKAAAPGAGRPAPGSAARERELFRDPYAVLAKLAADTDPDKPQDVAVGSFGEAARAGGDAARDPFDPLYWHVVTLSTARTERSAPKGTLESLPPEAVLDARGATPPANASAPVEKPATAIAALHKAPAAGDQAPPATGQTSPAAERTDVAGALRSQLAELPGPRVEVKGAPDGILISVTDDLAFSMFAVGSAEPQSRTVRAMEVIANALAGRPGRIVVRGHTDARLFRSDTYDNWRLSTARAHMAAYMLMRAGVDEARIRRIEGYANGAPRNVADPKAAENRRIEILLEGVSR